MDPHVVVLCPSALGCCRLAFASKGAGADLHSRASGIRLVVLDTLGDRDRGMEWIWSFSQQQKDAAKAYLAHLFMVPKDGSTMSLRICALSRRAALTIGLLAWSVPALAKDEAAAIRAELDAWTAAFNARQADKICGIFAEDLRYKFGEVSDRGYNDVCTALRRSLGDETHRSHYTLDLREILVYGDIAVVRLIWTLDSSQAGSSATVRTLEPGMDIFKRQTDGTWKIIRYLAYTSPE
jgi:ketosteroid isomerase-like protein